MPKTEYHASKCPTAKTLELISGRWKPIILYLIQHKYNRFGLLLSKMPAISKKILTEQLRALENQGLIYRNVIAAKHPQIIVYGLTSKGSSLRELIDLIFKWGTENLLDDEARDTVQRLQIGIHQTL